MNEMITALINGPRGDAILLIATGLIIALGYLLLIGRLRRVYDKNSNKWIWTLERHRQAYDRAHAQEKHLSNIHATLRDLHDKSDAQYLALLRLQVHDASLPLSERVDAGKMYMKRGGNGETAAYVAVLETKLRGIVENRVSASGEWVNMKEGQ